MKGTPYHQTILPSFNRSTIWTLRVDALQESVLTKWKQFTIWNAGKQGRRLYRSLTPENQAKVLTKVNRTFEDPDHELTL